MTARQRDGDASPSSYSGGAKASTARWTYGENPSPSSKVGSATDASATSNCFTPSPVVNDPIGLVLTKIPSPARTWKWYSVPARTSRRATNVVPPGSERAAIDDALSISGGVPSASQNVTSTGAGLSTWNATNATFGSSESTDSTVTSGPRSTWRIGGGLSNTPST